MTSLAFAMPDPDLDTSGVVWPPSDLESDEPPMESYLHLMQMILLLDSIELFWKDRTDYFAAGNLTVYFSPRQLKNEKFRGPDFFVVLGTEKRPRKSWTVWDEDGRYPNVIVEILSDSTEQRDRGMKKQIYQDVFRTPDYFWFDPETLELAGFHLMDGQYMPLTPNADGRLWSEQMGLFLGLHDGKLRFFTPQGVLLPAAKEAAQAAEDAERRAATAEQRSARLAEKLRAMGIDPNSVE